MKRSNPGYAHEPQRKFPAAEQIPFCITSVTSGDVRGADNRTRFTVQMNAMNQQGVKYFVTVSDFKPFFSVEIDDSFDAPKINRFKQSILGRLGNYDARDFISLEPSRGARYHGFTGERQFPFLKLSFHTLRAFNKAKNLFPIKEPLVFENTKIVLYDSSMDQMLRFFHESKGFPQGWFSVEEKYVARGKSAETKKTTADIELTVPFKELNARLDILDPVPLKSNSYDIETESITGAFSEAVKSYRALCGSLVDIFDRELYVNAHEKKLVKKSVQRIQGYARFRKTMRAAFSGIDAARAAGVEPVYPKSPQTLQHIDECIKTVLDTKTQLQNIAPSAAVDRTLAAADFFFRSNEDEDEDEDDDAVKRKPREEGPVCTETVLDMLLSTDHQRNTKVETIDRIITHIFPPLSGDPIRAIGNSWCLYGSAEYHRVLFMVDSCDPIEGAEVRCFESEAEMLLAWRKYIVEEVDPDYEWGWNTTTFDDAYMFHRARELGIEEEFLQQSRVVGALSAKRLGDDYRAFMERKELAEQNRYLSVDPDELVIQSGQISERKLSYIQSQGRQKADAMMYYVRSGKYDTFTLDSIASTIITDKITGATQEGLAPDETLLCTKNIKGLNVRDYIHIHKKAFSVEPAIDKNFKAEIVRIVDGGLVVRGAIAPLLAPLLAPGSGVEVSWGLAKNDLDVKTMQRLMRESSAGRATVGRYCLRDTTLVLDIINKQDIIGENRANSQLSGVTDDILLFRGQTICFTSLLSKICGEKNVHIQDLPRIVHPKDHKREKFEGACVLDPKEGIYDRNPVIVNDFEGLYPSITSGNDLSPDRKVWVKTVRHDGTLIHMEGTHEYDNLPGWVYRDIEFDHFETRTVRVGKSTSTKKVQKSIGKKICRFATRDDNGATKGILPSVVNSLLDGRKRAKGQKAAATEPFMIKKYDQMQLACKLRSNSVYGCQGADTSPVRDKDVAACITAIGRACIHFVRTVVDVCFRNKIYTLKNGRRVLTNPLVVYGDTDSVFFTMNLVDAETGAEIRGDEALVISFELGIEVARLSSLFLPPPMRLAFEKVLMGLVMLSKKRYFAMKHEDPERPSVCKLMMAGLAGKRRDSCDFLKDLLGRLLLLLRSGESSALERALALIEDSLQLLVDGRVPLEKLTITCALRSYYKFPRTIKHAVLAERIGQRDPGAKPRPGDRVPFVFVVPEGGVKDWMVLGDRIETPEFTVEKKLEIDTEYYITNQVMKPVLQLLGLLVEPIHVLKNKPRAIAQIRSKLAAIDEMDMQPGKRFKERENVCTAAVQELVFTPFINKIHLARNKQRTIRSFFAGQRAVAEQESKPAPKSLADEFAPKEAFMPVPAPSKKRSYTPSVSAHYSKRRKT